MRKTYRKWIGCARVSTDDQNIDLQRDALALAGCSILYEETTSGRSANRLELENCLQALRSGDTLVFWRLDRLGRSDSRTHLCRAGGGSCTWAQRRAQASAGGSSVA